MRDIVVGVDVSTTAVKAIAFNSSGKLQSAKQRQPTLLPHPNPAMLNRMPKTGGERFQSR